MSKERPPAATPLQITAVVSLLAGGAALHYNYLPELIVAAVLFVVSMLLLFCFKTDDGGADG